MDEYGESRAAAPIQQSARPGAGRKPNPNPLLDHVRRAIDSVRNGVPEQERAVSVPFRLNDGETFGTRWSRIRRQLTAAGKVHADADGRQVPYAVDRALITHEDGGLELRLWVRS